jgi:hypothetical protein
MARPSGIPIRILRGTKAQFVADLAQYNQGELMWATDEAKLYIKHTDNTLKQAGGGSVTIPHTWAIDGAISVGNLPPIIVSGPCVIKKVLMMFLDSTGSITARMVIADGTEADLIAGGATLTCNAPDYAGLASTTNLQWTTLASGETKYIYPVITNVSGSPSDAAFTLEITYG